MGEIPSQQTGLMMNTLMVEKAYPIAVALLAAGVSLFFDWTVSSQSTLLFSSAVTFGAIISGFVGTMLSILTSLDSGTMRRIRKIDDYMKNLRSYMGWGLFSGIFLCCVSMLGMLCNVISDQTYIAVWFGAWALCLACLHRLVALMLRIFSDRDSAPSALQE